MLNHVILNSPPMIIVSTTEGKQRSFQHAVLQSSSTQAKKNQELTLSTKPVTLHAASAAMLSRGQKGDPNREPTFLSSPSAGIVSPDQRVAAVVQHRLHPTMNRGYRCCRCCCCCCCYCYSYYCCYCHAIASCLCSSGSPVKTLHRDQRGGWTLPSRRRFR